MKQMILPSTVPEFTWLIIDGFMEENGLAPLSQKKKLRPANTKGSQEIWNILSPYATRPKKKI